MNTSICPLNIILYFLLLLLFLLLHNFHPTTPSSSDDLIDKTCKQTPSYDLCISTLHSNPASAATDIPKLAGIIVTTDLTKATETFNQIQNLLKQETEPVMNRALAYCGESYIPVVKYILPQAIEALNKGQFKFSIQGVLEAGNQADACEKRFSESLISPISDENKLVHDLSDVAVSILNIL